MCSRFSLTSSPDAVRAFFLYRGLPNFPPRRNIAPTQPVPIVRLDHRGEREFHLVRWGLVPGWVKDPREFTTLINARSETVFEKPSFRGAIMHRRCLVPADGFYEWTGERGRKVPHYIRAGDRGLLAFAGIWETWLGADGSEFDSMAILTTAANGTMEAIHSRMPVILRPEDHDAWLDVQGSEKADVEALLRPASDELLEVEPVTWSLSHKIDAEATEPPAQGSLL
ncbi:MAG: SOS response-associated peptidase [Hyphomicrobiaceae bacterium]